MTPLLSIIIPVYNSDKFLKKCLDSIVCQEFENYEIIAINDGSTDNSMKILEEYSNKHEHIIYFTQENKGQGEARNVGVSNARGEFIWFVDSDDWIDSCALDRINKVLSSVLGLDGLFFTCTVLEKDGENVISHQGAGMTNAVEEKLYSGDELLRSLLNNDIVPLCCTKIFRTELFKNSNFLFEPGIFFEDVPFNASLISVSSKIKVLREDFYFYDQHENSTMNSACTEKHVKSIFKSLNLTKQGLVNSENFSSVETEFIQFYWFQLTFIYLKFVHGSDRMFYEMYLQELDLSTRQLTQNYFQPVNEDFPYGTLLGSLHEKAEEFGLDINVFEYFNFSQEFIEEFM